MRWYFVWQKRGGVADAASQNPARSAEKTIRAYVEMFAFGKSNSSATGITRDESKAFADNLMAAFQGYSLNDENFATLKKKYLDKLKKVTKIETALKDDDSERPVVTVIATTIDQSAADDWAIQNQDRVLTRTVINHLSGLGTDAESLKQDKMFQGFASRSINKFIDEMPVSEQRTIDVPCTLREGDNGKLYWAPEDPETLNEFLNPGFMVDNAKPAEVSSFIAALSGGVRAIVPPSTPKTPTTPKPPTVTPTAPTTPKTPAMTPTAYSANDKWLIYWYVCGTDIESSRPYGDVTRCIEEVEKANLSPNVKILMQAGGTTDWKHRSFRANNGKVGRYVYAANDRNWTPREMFSVNDTGHRTDMGSYEGLREFLEYGKRYEQENGVPEHRVFIFVDHGGGSLSGVCKDEFTGRMIGLTDIRRAFNDVFGNSSNNPPFEVVAFDTCVMSTYETAVSLEGIARYMVASQESIWGDVMFEYTGLLNGLSANPAMNGAVLGKIICDTYREDALRHDGNLAAFGARANSADVITMSVIDISRMPAVKSAYDKFGGMALAYAQGSGYSATSLLSNAAGQSERYPCDIMVAMARGGIDPDAVDLKNFAENVIAAKGGSAPNNLKQASGELITAIDNAVVYNKIRGSALTRGGGLSTPYPYVPRSFSFMTFDSLANAGLAPKSQSDLYKQLAGTINMPRRGFNLPAGINAQGGINVEQGSVFDLSDLNNQVPVFVEEDENKVSMHLKQEEMDRISGVRGQIALIKVNGDVMTVLFLGNDTNVTADWKLGDFTSEFDGRWVMINGQPIFVQVYSEAPIVDGKKTGTELYVTPIILNDRTCNLMIACDYPSETFRVIGARPEVNSNTPTGELYGIKKGDVVKPLYLGMNITKSLANDSERMEKQTAEMKKIAEEINELNEKAARGEEVNQKRLEELLKRLSEFGVHLVAGDAFTIGDSVEIKKDRLPDGHYAYIFEMINPVGGQNAMSEMEAIFTLEKGRMILREADDVPDFEGFSGEGQMPEDLESILNKQDK